MHPSVFDTRVSLGEQWTGQRAAEAEASRDSFKKACRISVKKGYLINVAPGIHMVALSNIDSSYMSQDNHLCDVGIQYPGFNFAVKVCQLSEPSRYHATSSVEVAAKQRQRWAEFPAIKAEVAAQLAALLGPRTEADLKKPDKGKKRTPKQVLTNSSESELLCYGQRVSEV